MAARAIAKRLQRTHQYLSQAWLLYLANTNPDLLIEENIHVLRRSCDDD